MGFRVNPDGVEAMGLMMGRTCEAAQLFYAHALTGTNNADEGVLLNGVFDLLDKYQALAEFDLRSGFQLAGSCSETLAKAAQYYRDTEDAAEASADATYSGPTTPAPPSTWRSRPFGSKFTDTYDASEDPRHPGSDYSGTKTPGEDTVKVGDGWPVLDILGEVNEVLDKVSVAQHVRDLMKFLTGVDWFDRVLTYVSGDWAELMRQGMAFRDISVAYGRIDANVMYGWSDLGEVWGGNAAGAAREWIRTYALNARRFSAFCDHAGVAVQNFARAAYHGLQTLNAALDMLIDALLKVPDGGLILGAGLAVIRGTSPLEVFAGVVGGVTKVADALTVLEAAVQTAKAAAAAWEGRNPVNTMTWPSITYTHPAMS